jgi:lysine 2,3-aminomutase
VPIGRGRALLRSLRGRVTGLAWPTYVLDVPGGGGKAPLGPEFAAPAADGTGWEVQAPLGDDAGRPRRAGA